MPLIVDGFSLGVEALPPVGDHSGHGEASAAPYDVTHRGRLGLIDRAGRIRAYYLGTDVDSGRVVSDLRSLLR